MRGRGDGVVSESFIARVLRLEDEHPHTFKDSCGCPHHPQHVGVMGNDRADRLAGKALACFSEDLTC